ncbi:hypothetical protein C6P10_10940 [Weissella confusa]|nr:hypothetical protein C6P10_10940 [Weissella confusa]
MFSKDVQLEEVSMYLKGVPPNQIWRKFGIKGAPTILNRLTNIQMLGFEGLNNSNPSRTNHAYSCYIKVIRWRSEHRGPLPVTAKKFHLRNASLIW